MAAIRSCSVNVAAGHLKCCRCVAGMLWRLCTCGDSEIVAAYDTVARWTTMEKNLIGECVQFCERSTFARKYLLKRYAIGKSINVTSETIRRKCTDKTSFTFVKLAATATFPIQA